jgi:hypothetical protein
MIISNFNHDDKTLTCYFLLFYLIHKKNEVKLLLKEGNHQKVIPLFLNILYQLITNKRGESPYISFTFFFG